MYPGKKAKNSMCFFLIQSFVVALFFLFRILFSGNHKNSSKVVVINKIIFIMKISYGILHTGPDPFQIKRQSSREANSRFQHGCYIFRN